MKSKLFFGVLTLMINIGVVAAWVCYADDTASVTAPAKAPAALVSDHEIRYEETLCPDWKTNWDLARSLYRDKKYPEALVQYEMLFTQKENIDEARWEYATILMFLKRWDKAKVVLEKLLAAEPESTRYRLAMASVSLETGNIDNGVALYVQLLEHPISEADKILCLEGLLKAREILGQKEKAAILLGQLAVLKPQDPSLVLRQAVLELELGNVDKANELCSKYDQAAPPEVASLALHAHIQEKLNNTENASAYWQDVIALDPDNVEAHQHLYMYYLAKNNWAMSFKHLEPLVKKTPNDVELLGRAADLNMQQGRIDRALEYYEYGLAVDPLNQNLLDGKKKAQKALAQDLLVLVENDGGKKLWQDIGTVAPDGVGVYREMASLLREQGKIEKLVEVLKMLNKEVPADQKIYDELALLLKQHGHQDELSVLQANRDIMNTSERN